MTGGHPPHEELKQRPFRIADPLAFNDLALDLFHLHAEKNPVYREFLTGLGRRPEQIETIQDIPFLPITAFRQHRVMLEDLVPRLIFRSSGTTGSLTSQHYVPWLDVYESSFLRSFTQQYGEPGEWRILALLPSYLERKDSSLVYMADKLMEWSGDALNRSYLYDHEELSEVLERSEEEGKKTLLLGVTFALLDLAGKYPQKLKHTIIMETGGMKGRRREMIREEVHAKLMQAFGVDVVHSEYGMTELLSQAWSQGHGIYRCPPWMKVMMRGVNDPFEKVPDGRIGGINVIDLANIASCPFIATQDLGRSHPDGSFEVLGRFDHSDLRGCNLMVDGA